MTATTSAAPTPAPSSLGAGMTVGRRLRRNAWVVGLYVLVGLLLVLTRIIKPSYGSGDIQSLAVGVLPIVFAAAAQTVAVISGGIDLSVGSIMALTNVTAAALMADKGNADVVALPAIVAVLGLGVVVGAINGVLVVKSRVPDIVVTLAMSFVWAGAALLVLSSPGGGAAAWFMSLATGSLVIDWLPKAFLVMLVVLALIWVPLRRSRLGLALYAVGSDRLAALRSGVDVDRTRVLAYTVTGLFSACGGLALTMSTGIGIPVPGPYTLGGVAAIVLGGVSLVGGIGGMAGPVAAAFVLALIRADLVFLGVDPNYSTVIQGTILVIVVMIGGLASMRRARS